jgi:hypothetical protein
MRYLLIVLMLSVSMIVVSTSTKAGDAPQQPAGSKLAAAALEHANVQGGLIVELGMVDAQFTADLAARDAVTLQVLDTDPQCVADARKQLEAKGLYGRVTVDQFDGKNLPYADNLVNLVVVRGE